MLGNETYRVLITIQQSAIDLNRTSKSLTISMLSAAYSDDASYELDTERMMNQVERLRNY